jgi:hypothetical protein
MPRAYLNLERLEQLPLEELRKEWARHYGAPAPALSRELLRMGLAYRLQERRHGGLSRRARGMFVGQPPRGAAGKAAPALKLTPGTKLVRDWHGVGHTVTVLDEGFAFDGRRWKSLSAIAKAITGTKWNGPRFFGLAGGKV